MALSELQTYILRTTFRHARPRVPRAAFDAFYLKHPRPRHDAEILGRSLERLVDRGLMIGFGHRTMEKWFIESVRLTPRGRQTARRLLGQQTKLPLS